MGTQSLELGHQAINAGLEALEHDQRDKAMMHFSTAFDYLEAIEDDSERRSELGTFGLLLDQVSFPDLAFMAAQEAVALGERLGDFRHLAEDIVTCGNAHLHMGNTDEALLYYRKALEMCVENGDLDNAASASTNIALIVGHQGDVDEAIRLMYQSLDYLKQRPHPPTEIITRIALTQLLERERYEPEQIFSVARPSAQFAAELRPDQWEGLRGPLEDTVQRYLYQHPASDADTVKADYLPGIF